MRLAAGLVVVGAACAGCSYDWTEGGAAGDAGVPEAGVDAGGIDAEVDVEADREGEGGVDGGGPVDAAAEAIDCVSLRAEVDTAKAKAEGCSTTPPDCESSVKDQCGCTVYVGQPSSAATGDYSALVQGLEQSGCALGCGSCPTPITSSYCDLNATGSAACIQ